MASIEFVPFEPGHVTAMGVPPPQDPQWREWREFNLQRSRGWTMLVDGQPLGAAGVVLHHPGTAEAWQISKSGWERHYLRAWLAIRRLLPELMEQLELRRVQAACLDHPQHWGWLEVCGFDFEGPMKNYGLLGEDYVRGSRVR